MPIADPAKAVESLVKRNPAADAALETRRLQLSIDANVLTDYTSANGIGGVDAARMEKALTQIAETYEFKNAPGRFALFSRMRICLRPRCGCFNSLDRRRVCCMRRPERRIR